MTAAPAGIARNVMSKTLLISAVVAASTASCVYSQVVVAAPGVEARQDQKNIFDALKYAWEQAQWADKLATLHSTLTTVREQNGFPCSSCQFHCG